MSYNNFQDLIVWQKARELKKEISKMVKEFPNEEKYRLCDHLSEVQDPSIPKFQKDMEGELHPIRYGFA